MTLVQINARWGAKAENAADCARRMKVMLSELRAIHPALSRWQRKGYSRSMASQPIWTADPSEDELVAVFKRGSARKGKTAWPEMGYSISAWNGDEETFPISLRVAVGRYGEWQRMQNVVTFYFGPTGRIEPSFPTIKATAMAIIRAWQPEILTVMTKDWEEVVFAREPYMNDPRGGWLVYLDRALAADFVCPAGMPDVEQVESGTMVATATQPFDLARQDHAEAVEKLHRALAPVRRLLDDRQPPSMDS